MLVHEELGQFVAATPTIESDHPTIVAYADQQYGGATNQVDGAVRLYYAVRDDIRYDPYRIDVSVDGLKATTTLAIGHGWCVSKSILLAACCRANGIPARLGFADVRNHLSTARMRAHMRTDVFFWHGYTSIFLGGRWVKATPAFNIELCEKFGLLPLEFDGRNDSIYHPFDLEGNRHMEYVNDRGELADVPIESIDKTFREQYGQLDYMGDGADFDQDVDQEINSRGSE
jgi:transglutaminase-like putative cysteine protease